MLQLVVTHQTYSTLVVRRTKNKSLCSFPEPSILFYLTLVLEIRKGPKDTILIYNTSWNTALSLGSCIPNRKGLLRVQYHQSSFSQNNASTQAVSLAWKRHQQQGGQHGSPAAAPFFLYRVTCSETPLAPLAAEVGIQTESRPHHCTEEISLV